MKSSLWFILFLVTLIITDSGMAQWAQNKNTREDARYVRIMQGSEDVVIDGIEDAIWSNADSIIVGYAQTKFLPGSGYDLWAGVSATGDSANAVFKCLYKAPYIYLLYKVVDKSVGGWKWSNDSGFDGIIMSFKDNTVNKSWVQAWDKRIEHFYTWGYSWAYADSFPNANLLHGASPLYMGNNLVAGGKEEWRNPAQKSRWTAVTTVNGTSMDSLPDVGWVSEHRINVDSLGFNLDRLGDVLPFSFSMFDSDNGLDSNKTNNRWNRTWWGCPWNENWYYSALFIDPNVTTSSSPGVIPPPDYTIPHLRSGSTITIDGSLNEWQPDNALHFRAKYGDDASFNTINGTGAWASGYQQLTLGASLQTVVDGPEVDYWVTFDDANLYVGAKVTDQIVTIPYITGQKDGITFFLTPRKYVNGSGIFPSKTLTVNIDSAGLGQAGDDLVSLVDTGNVTYMLALGNGTNVNDISGIDSGYTVELKIPFATFSYPIDLGDSVVFIGALNNDLDIFEDANSNYYAKTWWFVQQPGQHAPSWVALGPANPSVGINDDIAVPTSITLFENYPNPFNPVTTIGYTVNVNADVTLSVYNILGQVVSEIKRANVTAGYNEFKFSAGDLSSGVYLYQLKVKNLSNSKVTETKVNKMILLK
jgi:hypothetical protein